MCVWFVYDISDVYYTAGDIGRSFNHIRLAQFAHAFHSINVLCITIDWFCGGILAGDDDDDDYDDDDGMSMMTI